ncbi:hypothetical protein ACLI5Y_15970 [Enterococcus innesii]|uniref:hypothetical protein n=1 Tax=Enterococcus innesii TaxID=2839759 RepID=UPI000986D693|nr:hypothetical protein [Enterococcus innesii]OOG24445.1 hypothetical protein BZK37_14440 [Enterococcus casseliflavus]
MENITIGEKYVCRPVGASKPVIGVVEKLYVNTALIVVSSCEEDQVQVEACNRRMIVSFNKIFTQTNVA